MIISLTKDIFNDNSNEELLDRLWFCIEDRYSLYFDSVDDIETLRESNWYKTSRESVKEVIDQYITSSTNNSTKNPNVVISNKENDFSIEEAYNYLNQPLTLLLENSYNDGFFIHSLIKNYRKSGRKIEKFYKNKWLKFGMGGGSTIKNVIQEELRSFTSTIYKKDSYKYLRYFVILDSDKVSLDSELSDEKMKLITFLESNEIDYHVLDKREIENYMPFSVIDIMDEADYEFKKAYAELSPIQKDFFDLEKGFPNINFNDLNINIRNLYSNLSESDKKIFRNKTLYTDEQKFKSTFASYFDSELITQESLNKMTEHQKDPNELKNILNEVTLKL